jgi:2-keto-3-deoxy-L-fuconate dehydrogenase
MFSLTDRTAVITGGGSGIGKAIALLFARQGASVHVIELNASAAAETVNEVRELGGKAESHSCDVSIQEQVLETFNQIGQIDILVNNAGIAHVGKADTTSPEDFSRVFDVNVKGAYNTIFGWSE